MKKHPGLPLFVALSCLAAVVWPGAARAQVVEPPPVPGSLKNIPIPEPSDLSTYIRDKAAAIRLGKALFWDMQLGSDNQACASCHFHAGADDRATGQLDPGLRSVTPDDTYQLGGPNFQLQPSHFPFHRLEDPENRHSTVLFDTNDVVSSLGTFHTQFSQINPGQPRDSGTSLPDADFNVRGVNVRRVPPRNTPSVINAVFNTYNFWDGRANYYFNGNNPFGALDMDSGIFVDVGGSLHKQIIRIEKSSLASQAVGPPLSDMEMSFSGRSWPDVGKKMLSVTPLAMQVVNPTDSVLGPLSKASKTGGAWVGPGLNTDYATMIRAAFWDQYWSSNMIVTFVNGQPVFSAPPGGPLQLNQYAQMEANFAFFFGLAVQCYESTLVSDDSPWDRHAEDPTNFPLTTKQALGLGVFLSAGKSPFERERGACVNCHTGSELTNASFSVRGDPTNRIEIMLMGDGGAAFYDGGSYNTGNRPANDDIGRDGDSPFTNPLTGQPFPLSLAKLGLLARSGLLPPEVAPYIAPLPFGVPFPDPSRTATIGAFKTPSLRNSELTGPYFHNGGQATLRQVVDFYDRGSDFAEENIQNLHFDIVDLFLSNDEKDDLVDFMLTLTDERVRNETAPFDHPQLFVPNGSKEQDGSLVGDFNLILPSGFRDTELVRELPPVGVGGLPAEGLPPIQTFLGLDPHLASTQPPTDLTIAESHAGSFVQGQVGASYALAVTNAGGTPSVGTVTVVNAVPAGLAATAISGTGWTCTQPSGPCTRNDVLGAGQVYPSLALTVTVAPNAASLVTAAATVSGGGDANAANNAASDPTTVLTPPDLTVALSHAGSFVQGQTGAAYTLTVGNAGGAPTSGLVSAGTTIPTGLTATAIAGTGWACTQPSGPCTRNDALAGGQAYPSLALTVNVAANAAATIPTAATVSGGGEVNAANDTASDPTTVLAPPDLTIAVTHAGSFVQGQVGATYAVTVGNAGTAPTSGLVTVTDAVPAGLTATGINGAGWTCAQPSGPCTRSDVLASGSSFPTLTLSVNVSTAPPPSVTNTATVSGGGELNAANDAAADVTTITGTTFFAVVPCRILDTRNANGPLGGPALQPGAIRNFPATSAPCGVPASATAMAVNFAVTGGTAGGSLSAGAGNLAVGATTVISFGAGQTRANNGILGLATDASGTIAVGNVSPGTVHLIVDVVGYFK